MDSYTIERIGDDNVIRLSDEELARHGLAVGDRVEVTNLKRARKEKFDRTMQLAEEEMQAHAEALAVLAK